jgi:DNA-directed RNA polymerase specialized sigma subunit
MYYYDDGFKVFASTLEATLADMPSYNEEELIRHQRAQIKNLVALETEFRKTLIAHKWGPAVYADFVDHICIERGNILSARPYFRERQTVFTAKISKALKKGSPTGLYKYRVNWTFISWVLECRKWAPKSPLRVLAQQILDIRSELLEQNIPLAVSQAKLFFASTPRSHLTFMDVVQIQCQGLLLAIDKFVPPVEKGMSDAESLEAFRGFRAVAIGIMRRDRVNDYSQTLMHFYPGDRQKIYWANKMTRRYVDEVDHAAIATEINLNLPEAQHTSSEDVSKLVAAASTVSADYAVDSESDSVVESTFGDDCFRPDVRAESEQLHNVLFDSIAKLSMLEIKLLKLKGIRHVTE